jgi:Protein of unknown function (DUF3891)
MIFQQQGDQLLVIRQTDHALLSGYFAREWGNERFARPQLFDSFCLAAREHDNGWTEWELAPQIDPKTGLPYSFMSIPTGEHMALYARGIERVAQVDRYAGLLVNLHCARLYESGHERLPGFAARYVKSDEERMVDDFVQRLRLQQLRLKVDLRMNPATKSLAEEKALARNARLLGALDRLSLHFCLKSAEDLKIESVPLNDDGEVDWQLHRASDGSYSLEPFPFRKDPLSFSILARRVPKKLYGDASDFQKELGRAPFFAINFTLRDGASHAQSAVA